MIQNHFTYLAVKKSHRIILIYKTRRRDQGSPKMNCQCARPSQAVEYPWAARSVSEPEDSCRDAAGLHGVVVGLGGLLAFLE